MKNQEFKEWFKRNELALKCKPRTQRASYTEFFEGEFKGEKVPEFKRGEIYFAKLTDSAKTRPFLIYQNDFLNRACFEGVYHTVAVLPLSGQILGGDYRIFIKKRDNMSRDSEIVATAIGIISTGKIIFSKGLITTLNDEEMKRVDTAVMNVLGIKNAV
ncbi:type II toxin-antitoxin system PemK/MazF family toxin [Nautilia sp.]